MGANIPYPYDMFPIKSQDDRPGGWTLLGAAEALQQRLKQGNKDGNTIYIDAGEPASEV